MSQSNLIVVTGNKSKAAEIAQILGRPVENIAIEIQEIQSLSVADVAAAKARAAFDQLHAPVIVDDTGMSIDCLNGLPGALVSWFLDAIGPAGILRMIEGEANRSASVSTCVAFCNGDTLRTFEGVIQGTVAELERGSAGFGYDSIFIPCGSSKTYAEMTPEEKNSSSMRASALNQLSKFLDSCADAT